MYDKNNNTLATELQNIYPKKDGMREHYIYY